MPENLKTICGLMSGTSLDGIDAAISEFYRCEDGFGFELKHYDTFPYPAEIRRLLKKVIFRECCIADISYLNFALSYLYANAVKNLCAGNRFDFNMLDALGMHGQTVWHSPEPKVIAGIPASSTFQLGNPAVLAQKTGLTVCSDFRSADIAQGGQGAPFVPVFDWHFFRKYDENVIMLNIGGIANITYLPAGCSKEEVIAFDTGPGNCLIDDITEKLYDKPYDINGEIARSGDLIEGMFGYLQKIEFIRRKTPKSTGRELFNENLLKAFDLSDYKKEDIIRTLTEFSAWSIAENIRLYADTKAKIIASGGGVRNSTLMKFISAYLPDSKIITAAEAGIPGDAKEAVCFGFLAYLLLEGIPANIPSVTGSLKECHSGSVTKP